jgi:hypothetical protein
VRDCIRFRGEFDRDPALKDVQKKLEQAKKDLEALKKELADCEKGQKAFALGSAGPAADCAAQQNALAVAQARSAALTYLSARFRQIRARPAEARLGTFLAHVRTLLRNPRAAEFRVKVSAAIVPAAKLDASLKRLVARTTALGRGPRERRATSGRNGQP